MKTTTRSHFSFLVLLTAVFMVGMGAFSKVEAQFEIDFDTDENGVPLVAGITDLGSVSPYANLFGAGVGVELSTDKPGTNPLNLYNTEGTGGLDDDLERNSTGSGLWAGGNATSSVFDNVLIVNDDGNISAPDDEGSGGKLILNFDIALTSFGFDFVDMDTSANASLILTDTTTNTSATLAFSLFEDGSGSIHEVSGALFGNRNANSILDIRASEVGLSQFDQVTFDMQSSGGIGAAYGETVPEPGSGILLLVGAGFVMARRVRQRKYLC